MSHVDPSTPVVPVDTVDPLDRQPGELRRVTVHLATLRSYKLGVQWFWGRNVTGIACCPAEENPRVTHVVPIDPFLALVNNATPPGIYYSLLQRSIMVVNNHTNKIYIPCAGCYELMSMYHVLSLDL